MLHAKKKGLFILVTSLALLLAACGGSAPVTESAPTVSEATTAPTEAGASAPAESTAPTATSAPTEAAAAGEISFSKDILPVFESRCVNCHGGQRTSEGLDLKTYESLVTGSENGSVLTPGDAANSLLVELAASGKMPKRGPKLTPAEIQLLTDWVNAGAPNN